MRSIATAETTDDSSMFARRTSQEAANMNLKSPSAGRRIVLAKVGLDGHDRGIKVIARGLRDAGFQVIYAGIWQSPEAVAQAVGDEDADWLGISLLNGAHMVLVPRVIEQLRDTQQTDVGIILGGIIPVGDVAKLKEMGVADCFGPGTKMTEIVDRLRSKSRENSFHVDLVDRCSQHDRRALSKLLTSISQGFEIDEIRLALRRAEVEDRIVWDGRTVAFTGSPGVGKSSLISRLLTALRASGQSVAVLSCDPQSPITGGALLGDRIRMSGALPDEQIFIRSLATPSGSQGVAPNLDLMVDALKLAGFDWILIETVGVGQGDVAIRKYADTVVALVQPESGDSIQWEKAGLLEIADIVVIHKFDLPGADRLAADLRQHLNLPGGPIVPLIPVSAADEAGIGRLLELLKDRDQPVSEN